LKQEEAARDKEEAKHKISTILANFKSNRVAIVCWLHHFILVLSCIIRVVNSCIVLLLMTNIYVILGLGGFQNFARGKYTTVY
jgi:hypothetical protein